MNCKYIWKRPSLQYVKCVVCDIWKSKINVFQGARPSSMFFFPHFCKLLIFSLLFVISYYVLSCFLFYLSLSLSVCAIENFNGFCLNKIMNIIIESISFVHFVLFLFFFSFLQCDYYVELVLAHHLLCFNLIPYKNIIRQRQCSKVSNFMWNLENENYHKSIETHTPQHHTHTHYTPILFYRYTE